MELSDEINIDETLGRYLPEKSYFKKNEVLPKAFMPPPSLTLSVFRIDGLSQEQLWVIGEKHVLGNMPTHIAALKKIYGITKIKVCQVQRLALYVQATNEPPRHANICGWPEGKERQKLIAQELAAEAELCLRKEI